MIRRFPYLVLLVAICFNVNLLAQPELDLSFASTGKKLVQFTSIGTPQDTTVQADKKILMVGACFNINFGSFPICLIRLNEDGSFDTTFGGIHGNTGYVLTNIQGADEAKGAAAQSDGKIVVITSGTFNSMPGVFIVRYNSNGSLDSMFGINGIAHIPISTASKSQKVVIQPDGKIVVVGYSGSSNYKQFVVRALPNGTPDVSFGNGGVAMIDFSGNLSTGLSVTLQPDGKIVTGGATTGAFFVARLNQNGSPDTTFDGDGFLTVPSSDVVLPERGFFSVAVQTDGRILALGNTNILYRFNSNGSLDTGFDADGSRPALNGTSESYDLVVTPSGKITVVGYPSIEPNFPNIDYRVARYLPDGSPDTTFSGDGYLDINIDTGGIDGASAVALDPNARIVIVGRTSFGGIPRAPWNNPQYSVARLLASPTQNVTFSGRVTDADGKPVFNAYVTMTNGAETIGIARTNPFGYFRFKNIESNKTYTLSTKSKGLNFPDRSVLVDDAITNYPIIGSDVPILVQRK